MIGSSLSFVKVEGQLGVAANVRPFAGLFLIPSGADNDQAAHALLKSLKTEIFSEGLSGQAELAGQTRSETTSTAAAANGGPENGNASTVGSANGNTGPAATQPKRTRRENGSVRLQSQGKNLARKLAKVLATADALHALKNTPQPVVGPVGR
ncbi:MAG: hypothetical protein HY735_01730 [Verrucomicrobia bacterium]|nr:hypothetical protein [Verrucomicrobiota bacterium]